MKFLAGITPIELPILEEELTYGAGFCSLIRIQGVNQQSCVLSERVQFFLVTVDLSDESV